MAKRVMWTFRAHADGFQFWIIGIPEISQRFSSKKLNLLLKKTVTLISENPNIDRLTNVERVRAKLVKSYLIFYEERKDQFMFFQFGMVEEIPNRLLINS